MAVLRAAALLLLVAAPAQAQYRCGPREAVLDMLEQKYGEAPTVRALTNGNSLLEVISNDETWTITITDADGTACLIAAGTDWIDLHHDAERFDPTAEDAL